MRPKTLFYVLLIFALFAGGPRHTPQVYAQAAGHPSPYAPAVSVITVSANPTSILADGYRTSQILITLTEDGFPGQRKEVNVSTTLGSMDPIVVTTNFNGQAYATLRAGKIPGTATITAWNDDASDQTTVELLPAIPASLTASAMPSTIDADGENFSFVTAQVKAIYNLPIQGYTLTFTTTLGTIPITGVTNAQGIAVVKLTAGLQTGTAIVTIGAPPLQTSVPVAIVPPRMKVYLPVVRK